jgi:protein phosphatase
MNDDNWDDRLGVTPYFISNEYPPPSTTVQAVFGARSRPGRLRTINDDHYLIIRLCRNQETLLTNLPDEVVAARFDEYGYAMVVADGLGSARGGGNASHLAITTLIYLVRNFSKWNLRVDGPIAREIMTRAERFYRHVDSAIVHERRAGGRPLDQTTLTATFSAGRDLFFAHVGHSRAYLLRADRLMRLTRDHTIGKNGASVVSTAPLVDVNAVAHDLEHILTNTIGMKGSVGPRIDLEQLKLADNDRVLVCTNGLTDTVDELMIAEILAAPQSPDEQSRMLVDLAIAAGAEDDVTALVAHYRLPS